MSPKGAVALRYGPVDQLVQPIICFVTFHHHEFDKGSVYPGAAPRAPRTLH
jgi:hypothetical protein